jgi:hypothetical protein
MFGSGRRSGRENDAGGAGEERYAKILRSQLMPRAPSDLVQIRYVPAKISLDVKGDLASGAEADSSPPVPTSLATNTNFTRKEPFSRARERLLIPYMKALVDGRGRSPD